MLWASGSPGGVSLLTLGVARFIEPDLNATTLSYSNRKHCGLHLTFHRFLNRIAINVVKTAPDKEKIAKVNGAPKLSANNPAVINPNGRAYTASARAPMTRPRISGEIVFRRSVAMVTKLNACAIPVANRIANETLNQWDQANISKPKCQINVATTKNRPGLFMPFRVTNVKDPTSALAAYADSKAARPVGPTSSTSLAKSGIRP